MTDANQREFVKQLLMRNRCLALATTDGTTPWIAPLEYMIDDDLTFTVFSTSDSRHVRDLEKSDVVAVAVYDQEQPEYGSDLTASLNGVQIEAVMRKVPREEYSEAIVAAIDALKPPMPPYEVYKIVPRRFYIPRIEDGVNVRVEVE